jgi:hypothetical protein
MYAAARSRQDERRRGFKKGIDASDSRRRRVDDNAKIRKNKREELALKRRNINLESVSQTPEDLYLSSKAADNDLAGLIQMIFGNDEEAILNGTRSVRKILSREQEPPIDEVIESDVVPRLVELLQCPNDDIQFEAAWALTNVASGTSKHTKAVLQAGAVPAFVKMSYTSEKTENREQATWALGNIAGDSCQCRDYVLSCGALPPLIDNLKNSGNKSFLRNGTWTLSNLVRGKPAPDFDQVKGCLEPLYRLLHLQDEEILGDACWAISYITDGEDHRIQAVVEAGLVPRLVKLMRSPNQAIVTPALRAVGNIVTGSEEQTQAAIDMGALLAVRDIIEGTEERSVLKECAWAISNVTAGTAAQIQVVLECGLAPLLLQLMEEGEFEVRKEVTWTITNAISGGNDEQTKYLMKEGFLKAMVDLLTSHDVKVVTLCLEALGKVLKIGETMMNKGGSDCNPYALELEANGGLEALEDLQNHSHKKIHGMSGDLLDSYFEGEEENLFAADNEQQKSQQTQQPANQFAFGAPAQFGNTGGFSF